MARSARREMNREGEAIAQDKKKQSDLHAVMIFVFILTIAVHPCLNLP